MLPQTGSGRTEVLDEQLELIATIFVVPEHVETCETRTEQNVLACISEFRSSSNRFRKISATRVSDTKRRAMQRKLSRRFANQDGMFHPRRDPVHKSGEVAALGLPSRNQNNRSIETRHCSLDGMEVR